MGRRTPGASGPAVEIVRGHISGAIGRVAVIHGTCCREHWGFGLFFEAQVANEMAACLGRHDERRDG